MIIFSTLDFFPVSELVACCRGLAIYLSPIAMPDPFSVSESAVT